MLIKIIKKKLSTYDNLNNLIYNENFNKVIIYNSIPFKYLNKCWLICKLNGFEGYLGDNLDFDIEIIDKNKKFKIINKRIISFYEKNYLDMKPEVLSSINSVCYYDIYLNLMLIKIPFQIENNKLIDYNILKNLESSDYENLEISYPSDNYLIEKKKLKDIDEYKVEYKFIKKYITGPEILIGIINFKNQIEKLFYSDGVLFNKKELIGIVSNLNENKLYFIPIISIKKMFLQINNLSSLYLKTYTQTIKIDEFEKESYGIMLLNNIINTEKTFDLNGNKKIIETKLLSKETIIKSVDGYQINKNGNLVNIPMNKYGLDIIKEIPLSGYLWFFKETVNKNEFIIKLEIIKKRNYNIDLENNKIKLKTDKTIDYENKELFIINNFDCCMLGNYLNYITYIKKNIFLIELNNVVLSLIEKILFNSNKYEEIIQIIYDNKYNKNTIIIGVKINEECPFSHFRVKIKVLKKYKSINEIELKHKNIDNFKKFLINIFTPLDI